MSPRKKKVSVVNFGDDCDEVNNHDSDVVNHTQVRVEVTTTSDPSPPLGVERTFSKSEIDPALVMAATIFVEGIVRTAEAEVQSRFNQERRPNETQVKIQLLFTSMKNF